MSAIDTTPKYKQEVSPTETCSLSVLANRTPGEVRCPVCSHLVPPEHIGYKLHCRNCGYLESCCTLSESLP